MSRSINSKLEVCRSVIVTGCRSIKESECLLNWVEDRLLDKIISLDDLSYWEGLLLRAKKGDLTRNETMGIPYMREIVRKYEFLSYCMPTSIETTQAIETSVKQYVKCS